MEEPAHRVPLKPWKPGAPPRPFLLRLFNYRDRDRVLAVAGAKQDIPFENTKLLFFLDYSKEVQQRRKSYTEIWKRLREKSIKFSLLFPSRLRIVGSGQTFFF